MEIQIGTLIRCLRLPTMRHAGFTIGLNLHVGSARAASQVTSDLTTEMITAPALGCTEALLYAPFVSFAACPVKLSSQGASEPRGTSPTTFSVAQEGPSASDPASESRTA